MWVGPRWQSVLSPLHSNFLIRIRGIFFVREIVAEQLKEFIAFFERRVNRDDKLIKGNLVLGVVGHFYRQFGLLCTFEPTSCRYLGFHHVTQFQLPWLLFFAACDQDSMVSQRQGDKRIAQICSGATFQFPFPCNGLHAAAPGDLSFGENSCHGREIKRRQQPRNLRKKIIDEKCEKP